MKTTIKIAAFVLGSLMPVMTQAAVIYLMNFDHGVQSPATTPYTEGAGEILNGATVTASTTPVSFSLQTSTGSQGGEMYVNPVNGANPKLNGYDFSGGPTITGSYTIEFLLNITEMAAGGRDAGFVSWLYQERVSNRPAFFLEGLTGRFVFDNFTGNAASVQTTTAITTGTWHHVAATYDVSDHKMRLYLDGYLEATALDTGLANIGLASSFTLFNGNGFSFARDLVGSVDAVAISSGALTPATFVILPVPEPSIAMLTLLGLGVLSWRSKSRRGQTRC